MRKESISFYGLDSCKKWISVLSVSDFEIKQSTGKRQNSISIYIDDELKNLLKRFESITSSQVLEKCLAMEVQSQISKWGCQTPEQFIQLMVSDAPLKILEFASINDIDSYSTSGKQVAA